MPTAEMQDNYITNYLSARGTLLAAKDQLEDMTTDPELSEAEQANAMAAFLQMGDEIAALDQAHNALKASYNAGVNPPPAALVAESLRIATNLGKVIAKAKTASAILNGVTQFVDAWTALKTGQMPAPAATPAPTPAPAPADG